MGFGELGRNMVRSPNLSMQTAGKALFVAIARKNNLVL